MKNILVYDEYHKQFIVNGSLEGEHLSNVITEIKRKLQGSGEIAVRFNHAIQFDLVSFNAIAQLHWFAIRKRCKLSIDDSTNDSFRGWVEKTGLYSLTS